MLVNIHTSILTHDNIKKSFKGGCDSLSDDNIHFIGNPASKIDFCDRAFICFKLKRTWRKYCRKSKSKRFQFAFQKLGTTARTRNNKLHEFVEKNNILDIIRKFFSINMHSLENSVLHFLSRKL